MSSRENATEIPFEKAMKRLEEIASQLEDGELALEKSLKLFEEGVSLAGTLETRLASAEMRVEQLLASADGRERIEALDAQEDGEE